MYVKGDDWVEGKEQDILNILLNLCFRFTVFTLLFNFQLKQKKAISGPQVGSMYDFLESR
jgi:hypothetical protein